MSAAEDLVHWEGEKLEILEAGGGFLFQVFQCTFSAPMTRFSLFRQRASVAKLYGDSYAAVRDVRYFLSFPDFLKKELLQLYF